jgi:hypothetical protein
MAPNLRKNLSDLFIKFHVSLYLNQYGVELFLRVNEF